MIYNLTMVDDAKTGVFKRSDLEGPKSEESDITGEEIERIADLFATAPIEDEEQDTGEFDPVRNDGNDSTNPD